MTSVTGQDFQQQRDRLVTQIERQGIRNQAVLDAMRSVPREAFLPAELHEFAYVNAPLPIGNEQTISQPYIVALMAAALSIEKGDRILEIGTGSGYAAAVLSRIAEEVFTIERYPDLAEQASARLQEEGYDNVHVLQGDGTLGWPEHAPYDSIVVAAGGPDFPQPLIDQLRVGGCLVIPVGFDRNLQSLVRLIKTSETDYEKESLGDVRFVPLVGTVGWDVEESEWNGQPVQKRKAPSTIAERIASVAEPFEEIDDCNLNGLLERIGDSQLVLIGEATHGTSEFYSMRARITQELILERGFDFVAIEGDWPDVARINNYVHRREPSAAADWQAFSRFPTWMWRNEEVLTFIEWLREHNHHTSPDRDVGMYGMDLYSMFTSLHEVLEYLQKVDPEAARVARERYGCLTPWEADPQTYGRAAVSGRYPECEADVIKILKDLFERQLEYSAQDGESFFDAAQNARLVANAEKYYRMMYQGGISTWNLRDQHMFDTVRSLLNFHGPQAKGVLWAHNSHLGNAGATEMSLRGETNVGQLCREEFGADAYLIGQATDHGTVAAASYWGGEMQTMQVRPSRDESYERLCHNSGVNRFFLPLDANLAPELHGELAPSRMERAIGVIYRPQTEVQSHYFHASLPEQFDELIWFDESHSVRPLVEESGQRHPPSHPFALVD